MAAASWKYSNLDENEKTALEDELNEFTKLSKSDTKEERLIDLSAKEAQEQPDVGTIIKSIAKMTWQEHSGLKYNGSGFLGKLMLGEGYRLGYFTAGHNLFDEGTQQVVNPKSVKLLFRNIRKYTIPILLSKLMCEPNILIVAYKKNRITIKEGKTDIQPCRDGIDFAALIFTGKIQVTEKFLRKEGLSFLNIGEPGTCGSKPNSPVQLYGFPQYIPDSPMRILPGVELAAPAGNIPFHYYTLENKQGASGASISNKGGRVIAIHIRGLNKDRGDQGNWGIGFDIIREELLQCPDISSLASKAEPGTSDLHKTQGMLPALGKFLENMKLEQYISSFEAEDIDMEVLEKCEHEELGQVLKEVGVTFGHKKKITEALQALRHEKRQIKEQIEKEQEREKDLLENVDANMFIKGLDSYTDAVERGETTFKVKVKDPNAPVDFYINGKKVSKSDTRCKYVNVGEGKHQLILHNIKMEDMGTIEARTPSNRGDEMLTSSTECEVAMGEHAPEVGDCGPVTGIPNKECCWKLPYKCEGVQQSPLVVTVMFRGKELKIGLDVNVIIYQGNIELSVINPKREKSGIYTVTMKNARGESSRDINVNIMGKNSEIVSLLKGQSKEFLNKNCKLKLDMDNENNAVTFLAEFPEKEKLRQILDMIKANDLVPCGPVIHLHNLMDTKSKKPLGRLSATLSLRHYLCLPEIGPFGDRLTELITDYNDKHIFVSFSDNHDVMAMKMHDYEKQRKNSASVKITTFSYWCFAAMGKCCNHQFPMDICILRPRVSSCPHERSQVVFVATGTKQRNWSEANEQEKMWDDPAHVEEELEKMCEREQLELAARRVKISLPSCHNEYETEVGMKETTVRNAKMQWEKCGGMSIEQFIFSNRGNGISIPLHMEKKFPFPNCEVASHVDNYPHIRLLPKKAPDPVGWGEWFYNLLFSPPAVKTGAPTKLFSEGGFSIYIHQDNKCSNIRIPEIEKPPGIAFVIGNSYHLSREHTLTSCPRNANKFKEYLLDTSLNLKYHWHVEPKIDATKAVFDTLLNCFANTELATNAEAICFYFSGHGIYSGREHYLILEDDERVSVDEIQRKIVNNFNSRRPTAPTKYYIFVIDVCRNGSDYSIQNTPSMLENTNNKEVFDHIFALWSTQRGDEAIPGDEESTFSQLLLSELRRGTEWNDLASRINENYQGQEGLYCSPTSCGTGFSRF